MNMKIMVTGRNRRIAVNICEHLESDRGYSVLKCSASKEELFQMVPVEMPHVIIICLGDETKASVKVYDVLRECTNADWITLIVISNEEDSKVFMGNTKLEKMYFLSRPVSLFALYSKLGEIEKEMETKGDRLGDMVKEFINPNADLYEITEKRKILVVDDDAEQLLQIKAHLSEFYAVSLVRSGKAAFQYLEKHEVDLILLDYLMPEMNGPEVLSRMRETKEYHDIPVIFLTGVTEREMVIKTIVELKPQGYIVKPSRRSEIVAKIIEVLDAVDDEKKG